MRLRPTVLLGAHSTASLDRDLGAPHAFDPLNDALARMQVATILEYCASRRDRHWFTENSFLGLMRLCDVESDSGGDYAEGFSGRKLTL